MIGRPRGIHHYKRGDTESSHKQSTLVALQLYKQPALLSATTGNHILGAELRKGPRISPEEMRGLESMTCKKNLKEPDPHLGLEKTSHCKTAHTTQSF